MQGTGAITLAAAISAVRICGTALRNQRVVIFGTGTAGIGIADQMCQAMMGDGLSKEEACARFWCVDRQGLLTAGMHEPLHDYQVAYARPLAESRTWKYDGNGQGITLAEMVRRCDPPC
jgi:malate dehydrogenase (oxaloacetate-decarboxylating)